MTTVIVVLGLAMMFILGFIIGVRATTKLYKKGEL
jgi:hypothetical protein